MATKTFEELKQMAIQIRDEKTNKQNTATRIGTQMLEHLNKLEQDFLDKDTTEGKFSELEIRGLAKAVTGKKYTPIYTEEDFLYKRDGTTDQVSSYKTKVFELPTNSTLEIKLSEVFANPDYVHIAYIDNDDNFVPLIVTPTSIKKGDVFYLTTSYLTKKILVAGAVVNGIDTTTTLISEPDLSQRGLDARYLSAIKVDIVKNSDKSITVNFLSNYFFVIGYGTRIEVSCENSYNIPAYGELYIDLSDNTVKVGVYLDKTNILLLFNEAGNPTNGLLTPFYYYKTFDEMGKDFSDLSNKINELDTEKLERDLLDVSPDNIIKDKWVNELNELKADINFDVYEYNLSKGIETPSTILMYIATGGGYAVIVNEEGEVLWSHQNKNINVTEDDRYLSQWKEIEFIEGGVLLRVTQAKKRVSSYPIRVLMDRQTPIVTQLNKHPLNGKKIVFIGDSITDYGHYINSIVAKTGCIAYNRGASGTTVAVNDTVENSMCERLDKAPNDTPNAKYEGFPSYADYVFVLGGINDWGRLRNQIFGSFEDAIDNNTFCGALKYLFRGLKIRYPNATIIALNLLHTYSPTEFTNWQELSYEDNDETKAITVKRNSVDKSLYDYRDAIEYCAKMYGIPVIDLFNVGFTATLDVDREKYYIDGLHPNEEGGIVMANYILNQLETIISKS